MRTTRITTAALLASLVACAPIGHSRTGDDSGPDAGVADQTCDSPTMKTLNLTLSGSDSSFSNLPTGCWHMNGTLTINGPVTSLAKLGKLHGVSDLVINGSNLTSIDTEMPLEVTRKLDIQNSKLTSLANIKLPDDASCLTYLGSVNIVANSALTDLGGVAKLMCVSGPVTIQNNVALTAIHLDNARRLEGGLKVADNTRLAALSLGAVTSITGDLVVQHNASLISFTTLSALQFMHGSVTIDDNDALTALPTAMQTPAPVVEVSLSITGNAKLTDLGSFKRLQGVNGAVNITNNSSLDFCEARQVGCCVGHNGTAQVSSGNKTTSCNNGSHSWCWADNGGSCPYSYTGQ
jgi:hypothetical protein